MFGLFKNIFGSKDDIELNEMSYIIDFVYSYEIGDTVKNAIVVFPPNYDEILVNDISYRLDTYSVEDIGYSSDRKYRKIKIPDFVFWVTPKDFKSFKSILDKRHILYMENKRLREERIKEQFKVDYNTPFNYDEIDEDIYKCFIAYQSGMSENIGTWDKFHKVEDEISNICSANGGKLYKSPAKSAKFAIIFSPHNRTYSNVKSLKDKGYKVTTFENSLSFFRLEHMWNVKALKKTENEAKSFMINRHNLK